MKSKSISLNAIHKMHYRFLLLCIFINKLDSAELKKSLTLTFGMNLMPQQRLGQPEGLVRAWG